MCIILFAYQRHPQYKLIVAANRDEFYSRPTAPAGFWPEQPDLLAGRDEEQGGTWMGITTQGRFAALTNYRDPARTLDGAVSRGELVSGFLLGKQTPEAYLEEVDTRAKVYNGFNLLVGTVGTGDSLWYYSNQSRQIIKVESGISGLSNHLLNTPWPKVVRGRDRLMEAVSAPELEQEVLWQILSDRERAADDRLPQTGVSLELERILSPVFIESPGYGTRASTILLVGYDGQVQFTEKSLDIESGQWHTGHYRFMLEKAAQNK